MSEELLPEIQSVTLPERNDTEFPADGSRCIMVGWGCTARGKKIPCISSFLHWQNPIINYLRGSVECLVKIIHLHVSIVLGDI